MDNFEYDAIVIHSGTPHEGSIPHSGRYEWGSGENPLQHDNSFVATCLKVRKEALNNSHGKKRLTNAQVAELMGMTKKEYFNQMAVELKHYKNLSTSELEDTLGINSSEVRTIKTILKEMRMTENIQTAIKLRNSEDPPLSNSEIARRMGTNESNIRNWLKEGAQLKVDKTRLLADSLARQLLEKKAIDVGTGVELELNTTDTNLKTAIALLKEEGYNVYDMKTAQLTNPGRFTNLKVLADKDLTFKDVALMQKDGTISSVVEYATDNGKTFCNIYEPESISSSRVYVRYFEDGGADRDGTIELRRGVDDLSIGSLNYAQVRIAVDGKGYMKGMAVYRDDIPPGYDAVYNSRKSKGTPLFKEGGAEDSVFKKLKDDTDNPFGATIKVNGQSFYDDDKGKYVKVDNKYVLDDGTHKKEAHYSLNAVNKITDEGDWGEWSKTLSSQFLSKQNYPLIKQQLNQAYLDKLDEFEDYKSIKNPAIKQKILEGFADDCDSAATDLKAAALPRQSYQVIIPITTLKDNEIFAPNYRDGETVVLIRHPHAGTFEIPQLTVNNKNKEGRRVLTTNAKDAVGINANVAKWLSGADFDGDTALVIPANNGGNSPKVKTDKMLKGLKDFDPEAEYPYRAGMKVMTKQNKGEEMGRITNLITDMTLLGAKEDEITRAVKHSMVVIDAEKHRLDYMKSYEDNNIEELKIAYQGGKNRGASTIVSKASAERRELQKALDYGIDPETGKKISRLTNATYTDKDGNVKQRTTKVSAMSQVEDAMELTHKPTAHPTEILYADYANKMKRMANDARKEILVAKNQATKVSASAKEAYADEVKSLETQLERALKNAPRERQAQIVANSIVGNKIRANPDMSKEEKKKLKAQVLAAERQVYGSKKKDVAVQISDREWEAIQNNAIPVTTLRKIMNNTDADALKKRAVPRSTNALSETKQTLIRSLASMNYTNEEIAERMGISTTTVNKYL